MVDAESVCAPGADAGSDLEASHGCKTRGLSFVDQDVEGNSVRNLLSNLVEIVQRLNRLHALGVDLHDCPWRAESMVVQLRDCTAGMPQAIRAQILDVFEDSWAWPQNESAKEASNCLGGASGGTHQSEHASGDSPVVVGSMQKASKVVSTGVQAAAGAFRKWSGSCSASNATVSHMSAEAVASRLKVICGSLEAAVHCGGSLESNAAPGTVVLNVTGLGGQQASLPVTAETTVHELKEQLLWMGPWVPTILDQKLLLGTCVLSDDTATIKKLQIENGANLTVLRVPYCQKCQAGPCSCASCHGWGKWYGNKTCDSCGLTPPHGCKQCQGRCRCSKCHGSAGSMTPCSECGRVMQASCWSGDTHVLIPGGLPKKVRECRVGDEVCTLLGSRRIARIWDSEGRQEADTEVCQVGGVWMTSHHPLIHGERWVFPAHLATTWLWKDSRDAVPDLYNFELEGHDDTIMLWGGPGCQELVISCTIGKYLGPEFGHGLCTRRSTRCSGACQQCDAVYMEGIDFGNVASTLRWAKFPEFPQVDWETNAASEFELAASLNELFSEPPFGFPCSAEAVNDGSGEGGNLICRRYEETSCASLRTIWRS